MSFIKHQGNYINKDSICQLTIAKRAYEEKHKIHLETQTGFTAVVFVGSEEECHKKAKEILASKAAILDLDPKEEEAKEEVVEEVAEDAKVENEDASEEKEAK